MYQKLECNRKDFSIVEGTTREIRFICEHDKELKLNDCKVMFILLDNGEQIRKKATVENDIISTCIDAIDTLNKDTLSYECRAFGQGGEVYHVALGNIFVIKSKVPVIEYEEE